MTTKSHKKSLCLNGNRNNVGMKKMFFIILGWRFISSKDSMRVDAARVSREISIATLNFALTSMICYLVRHNQECNSKLVGQSSYSSFSCFLLFHALQRPLTQIMYLFICNSKRCVFLYVKIKKAHKYTKLEIINSR